MKYARSIFFILLLALVSSCSQPRTQLAEVTLPTRAPIALLAERVISGEVLGDVLREPFGLGLDFRGYVYVADAGNDRLIRFKPDLTPEREIGGYGRGSGLFDNPSFVTFDNGLNLMVSDEGNRRICRFNSQLNYVDELSFYDSDDPLKFGYPSGIAFTSYGETWIADRERNQVAIFSNVGRFDRFLGDVGYGGGQFASPEKIISADRDNFIICDAGNQRLVYCDSYGNFVKRIKLKDIDYPMSAATDRGGVWVLDGSTGRVFCLNSRDGTVIFVTGPVLTGNGTPLKNPSDILLTGNGTMLISDTGNNRLIICRIVYENE